MDTQRIADLVKSFRTTHGLSQEALGERFQMSGAYVSRLENQQVKEPRRSDMTRLADVLGISVTDLTGDDQEVLMKRVREFESDTELQVFIIGLAGKLRTHDPETRRFIIKALNAVASIGEDSPEQASMG